MDDFDMRDLFAGLAMAGMLAGGARGGDEEIAINSYTLADAMLKERKYKEPEEGIASINKRKK